MSVLEAIFGALESGRQPSLSELGGAGALVAEADILVAAPVLDVLVVLASNAEGADALALDGLVLRAFREGRNAVPFREATNFLLVHPHLLARMGVKLQGILQGRVEERGSGEAALVAVYALEALFRMALANAATRHRPLTLMVEVGAEETGLFAEHAAKLAGAAFHVWREGSLLTALERLARVPDAEAEATFELGLAWLSRALEATARNDARDLLEIARAFFDRAHVTGGGREDAQAYRATVDLLRGFSEGKAPADLEVPLAELESAVRSRATWLDVANLPAWLRPRVDRDAQWLELLRITKSAASHLSRPSWLQAASVLDQVLAVYDADRTIESGPGLRALLRPRIEAAFVRERGLLAHLDDLLADEGWQFGRRKSAAALRAHIASLVQEGSRPGKAREGVPYPMLRGVLRDENLLASLSAEEASMLEDGLQERARHAENIGSPILQRIMTKFTQELARCADYQGETRRDFNDLLLHVLTFCIDRLDASRKERGPRGEYLYRANATEWDLQSDLRQYLVGNFRRADVRTEVEGVAAGRADIYVSLGARRFIIELKRDAKDVSQAGLRKYLGQAGAYQATNVRLGMLGVLDLVERTGPAPHVEESVWADAIVPEGGSLARHVVVFRVAGRLERPSSLSTPE